MAEQLAERDVQLKEIIKIVGCSLLAMSESHMPSVASSIVYSTLQQINKVAQKGLKRQNQDIVVQS